MNRFAITLLLLPGALRLQGQALLQDLPDDPGVQVFAQQTLSQEPLLATASVPCPPPTAPRPTSTSTTEPTPQVTLPTPTPCAPPIHLYRRFVDTEAITPMTVGQKGLLALHNIFDPANLVTIGLTSAFNVGTNAHSAYGPGMRGWAHDAGISFVQDATGETVSTFAIASLTHEDPHYHRMPGARPMRRVFHAIAHTYVSRHDDGRRMPNYQTLLGYPICAELSNLYVPGVADNAPSTAQRVVLGWAEDPLDNLITEFLPDVASRIHLRVVFVQRVLNRVAAGPSVTSIQLQ